LELGKDVLAIDPGGQLMAYQLKGNPSGRLTISQWQKLLPQINTLVYQPVSHPAIKPGTIHTPVLVTNGEINEDVNAAIVAYNADLSATLPRRNPLQTMARGQLLKFIIDSADTVWPVDIQVQRNILNMFSSAGDDELPMKEFIDILGEVFQGGYAETAIPSVHLVTAILASNWIAHENYFELVKMYVLLTVSSVCYQARWKKQRARDKKFIDEMIFDVRTHLRSFIDDLATNFKAGHPLLNKDVFAEFAYYHPRKKMISGLASAALLDRDLVLNRDTWDYLWELVCKAKHSSFMLWEGIIPYCLAEFWALSNIQGTKEPDIRLVGLINGILTSNDTEDSEQRQLPGPYYTLCDVVEWKYKIALQNLRSDIDRDSHYRRSWFADALFLLLVRRNYKSMCKYLWPALTKFVHVRTRLPDAFSFGPAKCDSALSEDKIIDVTHAKSWSDAVTEASQTPTPLIPPELLMRPALTLLYCLFVPQRMDRDVILWLDRAFCRTWY